MRKYILTDHEREMITRYIDTGLKINGFAVLKHNIGKNLDRIKEDYELLKQVAEEK